jgi:hypothetical protein
LEGVEQEVMDHLVVMLVEQKVLIQFLDQRVLQLHLQVVDMVVEVLLEHIHQVELEVQVVVEIYLQVLLEII